MPLVIVCGHPGAGKTAVAQQIQRHFEALGFRVALVNEESLLISRAEGYKDAFSEKITRASLKSAVERDLNRETVVIADSGNFIKGSRYELFCIARTQRTPHCVVWVHTPPELAQQWNGQRDDAFSDDVFRDLVSRFEAPNDRQRWDRPLFNVAPVATATGVPHAADASEADSHSEAGSACVGSAPERLDAFAGQVPLGAIEEALLRSEAAPATAATALQLLSETNLLNELDNVTQEMVNALVQAQATAVVGELLRLPPARKPLKLQQRPPVATLRRWRRQFIQMMKIDPPSSVDAIGDRFVDFLNQQMR